MQFAMHNYSEGLLEKLIRHEIQRALKPVSQALMGLTSAPEAPVAPKLSGSPSAGAKSKRKADAEGGCAIIGCTKAPRSRGFCAAHYQKQHSLAKAGRLPKSWEGGPHAPQSLEDVILPRGRRAAAPVEHSDEHVA